MSHLSEDSQKLSFQTKELSILNEILDLQIFSSQVYFFLLPAFNYPDNKEITITLTNYLNENFIYLNDNALFCFLADEQTVSEIYIKLHLKLKFQLCVAVKLDKTILKEGDLPKEHVSILILSKYTSSLKHTKTRINYSYCPVCNKTTKDYGGKKHLYHEYGTLISDVWRDIVYDQNNFPESIVDRLTDLFGLKIYERLTAFDLRKINNLRNHFINEPQLKLIPDYQKSIYSTKLKSKLINDDCLNALKKIKDSSIDFCFADPPYNLSKKYDLWDDNLELEKYFDWSKKWIYELMRVLKPGRFLVLLNIPLWTMRYYSILAKDYFFVDWIVWESLSMPVRMIMPSHYSILVFSKGNPIRLPAYLKMNLTQIENDSLLTLEENFCLRSNCIRLRERNNINDSRTISNLWWDLHRLKHNSRRVDHPTQLPPKIMFRLISLFTSKQETVLDPFNGAGTTSLCAEILDRNFIGIEKSSHYFEIAEKRHIELRDGIDPFGKKDGTPKSKNTYVPRLKKQKYNVSKKILQLEVKKISQKLGHLPSKDEVKKYSKYPFKYFEDYFINWAEVCAAARTTGMVEDRIISQQKDNDNQLNIFK